MNDASPLFQVHSTDMPQDLQKAVIEVAKSALEQFSVQREIAMHIKERFDEIYGSTWHCIVGRNFGSFISHEEGTFMYINVHDISILLFRTG